MVRLRPPRSLVPYVSLALFAVSTALLGVGCGADYADPPADSSGGTYNEGGAGNDIRLPPVPDTGSCTTGVVQDCTVYKEVGGIQNCFVGVQLCVEGTWGTCSDQEIVDELIAELGYDDLPPGGAGGAGGAGS